jgi:hypothetical protein
MNELDPWVNNISVKRTIPTFIRRTGRTAGSIGKTGLNASLIDRTFDAVIPRCLGLNRPATRLHVGED